MEKCVKCGAERADEKIKYCGACGHKHGEKVQDDPGPGSDPKTEKQVVQMDIKQFGEFMADTIHETLKAAGMNKVDRKYGIFPGMSEKEILVAGITEFEKLPAKQQGARLVKALLDGDLDSARAFSAFAQKASTLVGSSNSLGGYTFTDGFRSEVIKPLEKELNIRNMVRVIPVGERAGKESTLAGGVTMSWGTEGAAFTETNPTFGQITWAVNRLDGLTKRSRELDSDNLISLGEFLVMIYREAFAREERNVFATGNGSGKPTGLQNASGLTAYAQAGANFGLVDVNGIYYSLGSQYRSMGVWIMSDTAMELIDNLKDDNNRPLLQPSISEGAPPRLKGRPVLENEYIPANLGGGGNETLIYFGDPRWYYLFDREQMGVETTMEGGTAFEEHEIWIKAWERIDGDVALGEAFVKATGIK